MPLDTTAPAQQSSALMQNLASLWQDRRSYKKKLLLSFFVSLALCFTFLFFGPLEITASSADSLEFTAAQILLPMGLLALGGIITLSLLLSFLRGRIYNCAVTAMFSLTLCGYVQGNFLGTSLGALTGDAIAWYDEKFSMLLNFAIWVVLFLLPYLILYLSRKIWRNTLTYVSLAFVAMQLVALLTLVFGGAFTSPVEKGNSLTTEGLLQYGVQGNTLVFLLDRLDTQYVNEVAASDPHFFDKLDGFTSYTNAISEFPRTRPAANYMLTNCDALLYQVPPEDYFENSWNQGSRNLLQDLSENGYSTQIYTGIGSMLGGGKTTQEYVTNLASRNPETAQNTKLNYPAVVKGLAFLSAYRYLPTAMKPFFWCTTDDINRGIFVNSDSYQIDETIYDKGLADMTTQAGKNFKFYHFNGPHAPFHLQEDGTWSDTETNVLAQTKGSFQILYRAFDQMKKLGIYKDASILILADHGYSVSDYEPLGDAVTIGMFYKPAGSAETALQRSGAPVSLKNIPATVAKASGADYEKYGTPLDEVAENANVTRLFYKSVMGTYREKEVHIYEIKGDATKFANWKEIEVRTIEHPFY